MSHVTRDSPPAAASWRPHDGRLVPAPLETGTARPPAQQVEVSRAGAGGRPPAPASAVPHVRPPAPASALVPGPASSLQAAAGEVGGRDEAAAVGQRQGHRQRGQLRQHRKL